MQCAQPQRQSILIAPEVSPTALPARLEHPGVEQAPNTGKDFLSSSKDKVHPTLVYFIFPLSVAVVLAQDEHDGRHSRVSNSSSADGEYKDDPISPPASPRQSGSADKLFPTRRSMATTPERSHPPPEAHDDTDGVPHWLRGAHPPPPGPICARRTVRGEAMAERVEPPTVTVWARPDPNSRGVQLSLELKDDNASRQSFQNHSASPSTTTAGPPANETGFVILNRNKNALVAAYAAWLYIRRNLNYMGDVGYMISKLRGTARHGGRLW